MPVAALLFNGLHFSSSVMEAGIQWAQTNRAAIRGIFLFKPEKSEGYGFPSDLDAAQELSATSEANADDRKIIQASMEILQHACKSEGIEIKNSLLENPSEENIVRSLVSADYIFTSENISRYVVAGVHIDPKHLAGEVPGKWIDVIEN